MDMRLTSKAMKIAQVQPEKGVRLTHTMIREMMLSLPASPPGEGYIVWLENFFHH